MKKEVTLCDFCKRIVTKERCAFCNKDICENCKNSFSIVYNRSERLEEMYEILACGECKNHYRKVQTNLELWKPIQKKIVDYLKKAKIVQSMEEKEDNHDEIDIDINAPYGFTGVSPYTKITSNKKNRRRIV